MRYRAVIFDLNGTLADFSFGEMDRVVAEMAAAVGMPSAEYARLWAQTYRSHEEGAFATTEASVEHACRIGGVRADTAQIVAAAARWSGFQRRMLVPRPDAVPTLAHLKVASCRIGLIANSPPEVAWLWPETPFAPLVDVPLFSAAVGIRKPDPRIYRLACERLHVEPEECLFIGDGGSRELTGAAGVGMAAIQLRSADEDPEAAERFGREVWHGPVLSRLSDLLTITLP
jgi:putative hydrolase of the HAD superfamily